MQDNSNTLSHSSSDTDVHVLRFAQNYKQTSQLKDWQSDSYLEDEQEMLASDWLSDVIDMPQNQRCVLDVLHMLKKDIFPLLPLVHHRGFMGHMVSQIDSVVHQADILMSYFNLNLVKEETSGIAVLIEQQVLQWFHRMIYHFDDHQFYQMCRSDRLANLGMITSCGTMANLAALNVARGHALSCVEKVGVPSALADFAVQSGSGSRVVVLTSERAHYSIRKVCGILGIGYSGCIAIPTHPYSQKMSIKALREEIARQRAKHTVIVAVVAVASSTETGCVDDLTEISDICRREQIWMHVDAAWGGAYLLSKTLTQLFSGIERANSVVIDAHKLLGTTMGGGMVFFQDCRAMSVLKQCAEYTLREDAQDAGTCHLEGSRPFYALKIWMLITCCGRDQLALRIEDSHRLAKLFSDILEHHAYFTKVTALHTNILTYRWLPKPLEILWQSSFQCKKQRKWLCDLISSTQDHIHRMGWQRRLPGFVSKTKLPFALNAEQNTIYCATVLRVVMTHPQISRSYIHALLSAQHTAAFRYISERLHKSTSLSEQIPGSIISKIQDALRL